VCSVELCVSESSLLISLNDSSVTPDLISDELNDPSLTSEVEVMEDEPEVMVADLVSDEEDDDVVSVLVSMTTSELEELVVCSVNISDDVVTTISDISPFMTI